MLNFIRKLLCDNYVCDYFFPGATAGPGQPNAPFGPFLINNGWPLGKSTPINLKQFAEANIEDQRLYLTILAKWHKNV